MVSSPVFREKKKKEPGFYFCSLQHWWTQTRFKSRMCNNLEIKMDSSLDSDLENLAMATPTRGRWEDKVARDPSNDCKAKGRCENPDEIFWKKVSVASKWWQMSDLSILPTSSLLDRVDETVINGILLYFLQALGTRPYKYKGKVVTSRWAQSRSCPRCSWRWTLLTSSWARKRKNDF